MHQSMAPPSPATTTASYATASAQHLVAGKTPTATNNASSTSSSQIEQSTRVSGIQPHANAVAAAGSSSCSIADYASYFGHSSTTSASVDAPPSTVVSAMHGEHQQQQCSGHNNKTQQSVRIQWFVSALSPQSRKDKKNFYRWLVTGHLHLES